MAGKICPPLRIKGPKEYGKAGKPISLITNFFPVTIRDPDITLVHYDVTIKNHLLNEKIPKRIKRLVFKEWKRCYYHVLNKMELAFDGEKSAYSVNTIDSIRNQQFVIESIENTDGQEKVTAPPVAAVARPVAAVARPVAAVARPVAEPAKATGGGKKKGKKNKKGPDPNPEPPKDMEKGNFYIAFKKVDSVHISDLLKSLKQTGNHVEIPSRTMNILEVMFRHYRSEQFLQVGRNSYFSLINQFGQPWTLGNGREGATGFFASLRPAAWNNGGLLLNLDKSHCAFYIPQNVLDFMRDLRIFVDKGKLPLDYRTKTTLQKEIKGLKVRVQPNRVIKRTYRVNGVTLDGANKLMFDLEEGGKSRKISVYQYFREKYNVQLKFPQLNCLHVGNPQKNVYVPIELCSIEKGQRVMKKLSDVETSAFIRNTAVPPQQRLTQIKSMAKECDFNQDPILKALTFTIADQPLRTQGRILPFPTVEMKQRSITVSNGSWDVNNQMFHNTKPLNSWVVLNFSRLREQKVWDMVRALTQNGRKLGMSIAETQVLSFSFVEINRRFDELKRRYPDLQLIMCVLDNRNQYATIKKTGDCDFRIITQCVMSNTVDNKMNQATVNNILMKINAKLGGVNNIVRQHPSLTFDETLIMGADVNHPPAGGSTAMPSIAAVVGTINASATHYAVEVRAQEHRKEIIVDLTEMVINLLRAFKDTTKRQPSRIIMYRDGVSESQFAEVLSTELVKIRNACSTLHASYKPKITFLCVQKRHHTRLFCDNPRDAVGRAGNVPPGTIVDHDITHPTEIDFYLCSHQGIQGTSRPAHYNVLWDDSMFEPDQLQRITYELCLVYSRCSKSVSIPTPAYYAHWAAFRSKTYASTMIDDSQSVMSGDEDKGLDPEIVKATKVSNNSSLSNRLYYI